MWKSTTSASGDNHDLESEKQRETNEEASSSAGHGTATVEQRSDGDSFDRSQVRGGESYTNTKPDSDWKPASERTTETCP